MPTSTQSIREIVTSQPSAAKIFHRFEIDMCSQADLSLEGACKELQLSADQVLEKLADAEAQRRGGVASRCAQQNVDSGKCLVIDLATMKQAHELAAVYGGAGLEQDENNLHCPLCIENK